MRSKRSKAVAGATAVLMILAANVALADDIINDLDAAAKVINLEAGGASGSTVLSVVPQNNDGKQGCNLTGGTSLVVSVASSNAAVATVSPSSLTFTSCGHTETVTVTPLAEGSSTVSLSQTSNTTGGSFNLAPATFVVNVAAAAPSDTTPPVITPTVTGTLGSNGWYTSDVDLSWHVQDDESDISSTTGCASVSVTADQAETTYTCSATSAGGTHFVSVSIKRDATPPSVNVTGVEDGATYVLESVPEAGCSTTDALSGVQTNATVSGGGSGVGQQTVSCTGALDNAGNAADAVSATYSVHYAFGGWQAPVNALPTRNTVKAGRAIPIKFSLGGDQGMAIFDGSGPKVQASTCITGDSDPVEETVTAGSSSLQYDASTDTYTYVWKSDTKWATKCMNLALNLKDGSSHTLAFQFTK